MIRFIIKGILRDRSRSLLPIIISSIGVMLTVAILGYTDGVFSDGIRQTAIFETGHVKVMSKPYAENYNQLPIDLVLLDVDQIEKKLESDYPEMDWVKRTKFGGLVDVQDENGESKGQGPVSVFSYELFSGDDSDIERLQLQKSVIKGALPQSSGEVLIGKTFAEQQDLSIGDEVMYMGSTMNGSMAFHAYNISGLVQFGIPQMDKSTMIMDITDAQNLLNMDDGSAEILGFFSNNIYKDEKAQEVAEQFNDQYVNSDDEYAPVMKPLSAQGNLQQMIEFSNSMTGILIGVFILAMSIVLWNTGLLGGLRRYKEFGIRLAIGESKSFIYKTFLLEAIIIGLIGTVIGTLIGLAFVYYLQTVGIDISGMLEGNDLGMMIPTVLHGKISPKLFYIGLIPGVFAVLLGNALAGIGIFKRETASLFQELEV